MDTSIIITKQSLRKDTDAPTHIVTSVFEADRMVEVTCEDINDRSILGNIYVGKVKNVIQNLNAAFVELWPGQNAYYPLNGHNHPIFVKHSGEKSLASGDEIVVQIQKEAVKTKDPVVTTNLTFAGKYVVLSTENTRIGISNKLDPEKKKELREIMAPYANEDYGFVVRTNARNCSKEELLAEVEEKIAEYNNLKQIAIHRTCYSCLKEARPQYLQQIMGAYQDQLKQILTDDLTIYKTIEKDLQEHQPALCQKLNFYDDPMLSLSNLKNIRRNLNNALSETVWLRSGAYLVIQPTEALTVIDVNSGKNTSKKDPQENFCKINIEAAKEIAYQLRLRNISGICIVDFIDLEKEEAKQELIQCLCAQLRKDPTPCTFVEMTKLGLVEITRKKVKRSLAEQIR